MGNQNFINKHRIFTKLILVFICYLTVHVVFWFTRLEDPTGTQLTFVLTLTGSTIAIIRFYLNARKKDNQNSKE